MKRIVTIVAAVVSVAIIAVLALPRSASADAGTVKLYGEFDGMTGKKGTVPVVVSFHDVKSGELIHEAEAVAQILNGTYFVEMDSVPLSGGEVYAVSVSPPDGGAVSDMRIVLLQDQSPADEHTGIMNITGPAIAASFDVEFPFEEPFAASGEAVFRVTNTSDGGGSTGLRGHASEDAGPPLVPGGPPTDLVTNGVIGSSAANRGRGVYGFAEHFTGANYGVLGQTNSSSGAAVSGEALSVLFGRAYGVSGVSRNTLGIGVYGLAGNETGIVRPDRKVGVLGVTDSSNGLGVFGQAIATSGSTVGVYGTTRSPDGIGVQGHAYTSGPGFEWPNVPTPIGVRGVANADAVGRGGQLTVRPQGQDPLLLSQTTSAQLPVTVVEPWGIGVQGIAHLSPAIRVNEEGEEEEVLPEDLAQTSRPYPIEVYKEWYTYGVEGANSSPWGYGVHAANWATFEQATALYALTNSYEGIAVYGYAPSDRGPTRAVVGDARSMHPLSFGFFTHNAVSGAIKMFSIDHPDDPANKYLRHYCAEGPEPLLIYSGNVTLDRNGQATVKLPDYFEDINTDYRYGLTPIGKPMPGLYVSKEIRSRGTPRNTFQIAGGEFGGKVSWRVESVRNDPYVRKRGTPVEVEKQGRERGLYAHPELYGKGPEFGTNYQGLRTATSTNKRGKP